MSFIKKHKTKILTVAIIAVVIGVAFFHGETQVGIEPEPNNIIIEDTHNPEVVQTEEVSPEKETMAEQPSAEEKTEPIQENEPEPIKSEETEAAVDELTCTMSVRCDTILDNMSKLNPEKAEFIPSNGVIFAEREVVFYEGESVFNLLIREMKKNKIHMEFVNTPIYNSAYIEGIANIYEFDCSELSGWMYKVNGNYPNYGSSQYMLSDGDVIEWVYTCDLGRDIGGEYAARNGK